MQDFESESLTIGVEHSQKGLIHLFGHFPALFKFFYHRDHREHRDFCSLCVLCDLCGRNLYKCFPNLWNTENSSSKGAQGPQKVKATPSVSDYGSKDCAFCPDPTAVSRLNPLDRQSQPDQNDVDSIENCHFLMLLASKFDKFYFFDVGVYRILRPTGPLDALFLCNPSGRSSTHGEIN